MVPDNRGIQFSYISMKTYVVDTHKKCFYEVLLKHMLWSTHKKHLNEAILMSTHNICFQGEIRKI